MKKRALFLSLAIVLTFLIMPVHPASASGNDKVYLESGIMGTDIKHLKTYPKDASFNMNGVNYFRGLAGTTGTSIGSVGYNISGYGFTRLSGLFGRITGSSAGTLTIFGIRASGERVLLGGYEAKIGETKQVEVNIPSDVVDVILRLSSNERNCYIAFADAFFDNGKATQQPTHPSATANAVYLESGISGKNASYLDMHPDNATFSMNGVNYFRGLAGNTGTSIGSVSYDISGRGFTRLSGLFGRITGSNTGTLTIYGIRTSGERVLLGGYEAKSREVVQVEVSIPADVVDVIICFTSNERNCYIAFADAFFDNAITSKQPTHPPAVIDAVYLESGITGLKPSNLDMHPKNASFIMNGNNYFRGIVGNTGTSIGSVSYDISGRGFTKLSGLFGRISGSNAGTLTITGLKASGERALLGGYEAKSREVKQVEVSIPSDVIEVIIQFTSNERNCYVALADAYFSGSGITTTPEIPSPQVPKPISPPPVKRPPQTSGVAGSYYYTDIVVYLWNTPVNAVNIGGAALIDTELLNNYGFNVKWSSNDRTLTITDQNTSYISPEAANGSLLFMKGGRTGEVAGQYYYTDVITFLNGYEILGYNTGGRTYIDAESMAYYGYKVVWNAVQRTLVISRG